MYRPLILEFAELKVLDTLFHIRGPLPVGNEIVIAAIDEKSLDELGRWPWPRSILASLIDKITSFDSKIIGIDLVFPEPEINPAAEKIKQLREKILSSQPNNKRIAKFITETIQEIDNDRLLARSIKNSKRTILSYFFHFTDEGLGHITEEQLTLSLNRIKDSKYNAIRYANSQATKFRLNQAILAEANIKLLSESANGMGYINFIPDLDGTIRRAHLVATFQDLTFPFFSFQILKEINKKPSYFFIDENGVSKVGLGELQIPVGREGELLINYNGPANTFKHISVTDILNHRVEPSELKDKIVLIGSTAAGIYDIWVTPFSTVFPGVEVHANILENFLHNHFLQIPAFSGWYSLFTLAIIGIVLGLSLHRINALSGFLLIAVLIGGICFFNYYQFKENGYWLSSVYPLLQTFTLYLGISVHRYYTEEKEKKYVRKVFGQYVSPKIIEELINDPAKLNLGGEKKILTAFFSDIKEFSTISESLSPEMLVELLNVYMSEMCEIILKYDGTIDKFEGDAIIAFFGAPIDYPDHAEKACLCAVEMQKKLTLMREKWREEEQHELFMRIGLNTGPMVVGNMGSKFRMDYTIMGDSVNLASRLEGANKLYGSEIMISESTYEAAKQAIEARFLDFIRVVGKNEPVKVFEVLDIKGKLNKEYYKKAEIYNHGIEYYRQKKWGEGQSKFENVLKLDPSDGPAALYAKRCQEFKKNPPPADWDGVFTLKSK